MTQVKQACADCLEGAGGRQQQHKIHWRFCVCGACGKPAAVTEPVNFGNPPLSARILEFEVPA